MSKAKQEKKFTVVELFAGVGGFRLGLKESGWKTIWANQWEPGKKQQHAYDCYISHFGKDSCNNNDIAIAKNDIPRNFDLLVGGFPCQDYSVAATKAKGIEGKKGVLWWEIKSILEQKKPPFVLLENVDRLLRSPSKQRGRDFGIILACLNLLGYSVEWRMINAADYGFPQKRRRTLIFATKNKDIISLLYKGRTLKNVLAFSGFFAQEFKVTLDENTQMYSHSFKDIRTDDDLVHLSDDFEFHFYNSGVMVNGEILTHKVIPIKEKQASLGDILVKGAIDESLYIPLKDIKAKRGWKYCKGSKKENRITKQGFKYFYAEGSIPFPDKLSEPSRTMLTGEGNKCPNRITHVIQEPISGKYRIITPIEAERLNGFPDNWTDTGMPQRWRYFCMGNALVVGLIKRMGKRLKGIIEGTSSPSNVAEIYVDIDEHILQAKELISVR